jgi:2-(1,2-epoxy-1,2-dihydrophenyl)acetyl-CoA isomerase
MSMYETILLERFSAVAVVRLNRPTAANCLNEKMAAELADVAASIESDDGVRSVVLTGSGRFFCAGGDVKEMHSFGDETASRVKRMADAAHRAISSLARMRAPVVVAVNGIAAGGGFGLAMAGDIVLAAESASFTMAYTKAGLSPDGSSTFFIARHIGLRRLQELVFTNRTLNAKESVDWGLVTRIASDSALMNDALSLATDLSQGPVGSHAAIKQLLLTTFQNGLETQMEIEGREIASAAASADGREGIRAFGEGRAPVFN